MRGRPARPRALAALVLVGLALAPLAACVGPEEEEAAEESQLTPEELAELLRQGTIRPVVDAEGQPAGALDPAMQRDPFADFPPEKEMKGDPFAEFEPAAEAALAQGGAPPAAAAGGALADLALEPSAPDGPLAVFSENPYLAFGRRIKTYPDGSITKPFPLRPGTGAKMQKLIEDYGNFPIWKAEMGSGPSPPSMVKVDLLPEWDVELMQDMRAGERRGESVAVADWLVVTTGEDLLWDVEEFINLFAAGVPQIEIEAKIVEITFTKSLDIGIRPPAGSAIFQWPPNTFVQSLDYTLPNVADGVEGLLSVGGVQDGVAFNAILEAVATNDNVSIISRPKVAVREGGRAQILSTLRIPFLEVTSLSNTGGFNTKLSYQETGVQLYVVPRVVGSDTVALDIDIEASAQSGNQTVISGAGEEEISVPVLSTRSAKTVVYLRPGQAVILGGLINERSVERVRKVPLLGDVPLLKHLFRSTFTAKEESNVLFFIRPRILQGADLSREF